MSSFSYPPFNPAPSPPKNYPAPNSMSSAFSASANPNEDWTKISDLAERRRIQNRIAQRNYRKKLKKRLEDLERRAGSSSASPEQQPATLATVEQRATPQVRSRASSVYESSSGSVSQSISQRRTPDLLPPQGYNVQSDDRSMFSQQSTRQLSTSPPPFAFNAVPVDTQSLQYPQAGSYNLPAPQSLYGQYMPPTQHSFPASLPPFTGTTVKPEAFGDDELSPFGMSYASIANIDVPSAPACPDVAAYTPSLLDSLDFGVSDIQSDSMAFLQKPSSMAHGMPLFT